MPALDAPPAPDRLSTALPEVRRTMRLSIVEGSFAQVFLNWTSGSVLIGYMLHLGATPTQLGLVASVPLLAQLVSPLAAWLNALVGRRKLLTVVNALVGRGLWLLAAALPQLGLPPAWQPSALVLLVLASSLFQAGNATLWSAWMGDVVPAERRGRYFGLRTGVMGLVGMIANLGAGAFLDRAAAPIGFQAVLLVAVASAAVSMVLYLFHFDPPAPRMPVSLLQVVAAPLADPNFRQFLLFALYWQFVVFLSAPFVFPYFLESLGLSFTQIAVWSAIAASCALVTTNLWGRVADRVGNRAVLAIGTFLAGLALPLNWILAGLTGSTTFVWVSAVFDAVAWGAIGPAVFNLALVSAPTANRTAFMAMYSLATGVAGFLGGVVSGPLLVLLTPLGFEVGGALWTGYHWLFALSGVGRMNAFWLLRPVKETNAWRTRDVLRHLRSGWRGAGFPWRS